MNELKILTMPGCHACDALKKHFDLNKVRYDEYSTEKKKGREIAEKFGIHHFPTLFVVNNNKIIKAQAGFDIHKGDIKEFLK